jgi:putative transposase
MYRYRGLSDSERREVLQHRRQTGQPLHSPPHEYEGQGWFFITAATFEHRPLFREETDREWLLRDLFLELEQAQLDCAAWVVLPNHYHLLLRCESLRQVATALGRVHGRTSREINLRMRTTGARRWYRFSDRMIRGDRHYFTSLNYIHFNPVKHGYVESPEEWASTSLHWYVEHWGHDAVEACWASYPVLAYGAGWDD